MTQTLAVLIKLAERKVEDAEAALSRVRDRMKLLQQQMDACLREANAAFLQGAGEDDLNMVMAAQAFQERMRRERVRLQEVLKGVEAEELVLREELHRVFIEQKRYELLMKKHQKMVARRHAKKVQEQLDDVAQRRF